MCDHLAKVLDGHELPVELESKVKTGDLKLRNMLAKGLSLPNQPSRALELGISSIARKPFIPRQEPREECRT